MKGGPRTLNHPDLKSSDLCARRLPCVFGGGQGVGGAVVLRKTLAESYGAGLWNSWQPRLLRDSPRRFEDGSNRMGPKGNGATCYLL